MSSAPRRCSFLQNHPNKLDIPSLKCIEERCLLAIANLVRVDPLREDVLSYLNLVVYTCIGKWRPSKRFRLEDEVGVLADKIFDRLKVA